MNRGTLQKYTKSVGYVLYPYRRLCPRFFLSAVPFKLPNSYSKFPELLTFRAHGQFC